jgi:hypothetical protein
LEVEQQFGAFAKEHWRMATQRQAYGTIVGRILGIHNSVVRERGNPPLDMNNFVIDPSLFQGDGVGYS